MAETVTDLKRAYDALAGKLASYNRLYEYYDGYHPLKYSSERLNDVFQRLETTFVQNWCAVVVDAVLDRLQVQGWDANDRGMNKALDEYWDRHNVMLEAASAHEAVSVCGEGFIMVWDEGDGPEVYANDPRLVHCFYDANNPHMMRMAAKWWVGEDGLRYLTLYYPDRLEYYVSTTQDDHVSSADDFVAADPPTAPNPFERIPVFHLRKSRRSGQGELRPSVTSQQDIVNKLLADLMVTAEFAAFPQRWIITQADTSQLRNAPNEVWEVPSGDGVAQGTSVGQFSPADLTIYSDQIDKIANAMAVITRTPKHYFMAQAGANVSGEALIAMEAPLNKKSEGLQNIYGATWKEVGAFLAQLLGYPVTPYDLSVLWETAQTVQPLTEATARKTSVDAGIPLVTQLRREGWTQQELDDMAKDEQAAQAKQTSMAQALLAEARMRMEQQAPADAVTVDGDD